LDTNEKWLFEDVDKQVNSVNVQVYKNGENVIYRNKVADVVSSWLCNPQYASMIEIMPRIVPPEDGRRESCESKSWCENKNLVCESVMFIQGNQKVFINAGDYIACESDEGVIHRKVVSVHQNANHKVIIKFHICDNNQQVILPRCCLEVEVNEVKVTKKDGTKELTVKVAISIFLDDFGMNKSNTIKKSLSM